MLLPWGTAGGGQHGRVRWTPQRAVPWEGVSPAGQRPPGQRWRIPRDWVSRRRQHPSPRGVPFLGTSPAVAARRRGAASCPTRCDNPVPGTGGTEAG